MQESMFIGRMTRKPMYNKERTVLYFTLAINDRYKGKNIATYIPCCTFGKRAEVLYKYGEQGRRISVSGSFRSYIKEIENRNISLLNLIITKFEFLDKYSNECPRDEEINDEPIENDKFMELSEEDFATVSLFE